MEKSPATLPLSVDPGKAIALKTVFRQARLDQDLLTRLKESCIRIEGEVTTDLSFSVDLNGMRMIEGTVRADVVLLCQRCGAEFVCPLEAEFSLTPDFDKAKAFHLEDRYDFIDTDENGCADLYAVLEDSLLLEIPAVPKHDDDSCELHGGEWSYGETDPDAGRSPFAALAGLKETLSAKKQK